ncbi:MAG: mechanosensitive ion channel family protein [Actinobacteria bacterium]|nr:mechanosensitive ion channel family protein [Actinomycetota bacterium]
MENLTEVFDPASNSFWNLLLAVGVVIVSIVVARYVRRATRRHLGRYEGLDDYAGAVLGRLVGWGVVFLGVILALSVMGVDMVPVVLVIVLLLAFLVLSGQSLMQNWAAGLLLQARAPYRPGDRIESLGYVGEVETTNVRSVVLRTGDGQIVHIPNADVLKNPLVNRTGHDGRRRSSLNFGVAYGTDLDVAERLLVDAAASVEDVHSEPAPSAWVASLGESTVVLELRFWHDHPIRHQVRSDVAHEALARLDAAEVSMPFPTQELMVTGNLGSSWGAHPIEERTDS